MSQKPSKRARYAVAAVCGLVLLVWHMVLVVSLIGPDGIERQALVVFVEPLPADAAREEKPGWREAGFPQARWPAALNDRLDVTINGHRPDTAHHVIGHETTLTELDAAPSGRGMHRVEWSVRYRGGVERRVGLTHLTGPFQRPEAPPCSIRILVGQPLIDLPHPAGMPPQPGTLAAALIPILHQKLAGEEFFPLGAFEAVSDIHLRWIHVQDIDRQGQAAAGARLPGIYAEAHPDAPVTGVLRAMMRLRFEDGELPLWIAIIPQLVEQRLSLRTYVEAKVDLDSGFWQLVSDVVGGDDIARDLAKRRLDGALHGILDVPPPLPITETHSLRLAFCVGEPITMTTGEHAALPLAIVREPGAAIEPVLLRGYGDADIDAPPAAPHAELPAPLAIELDLDAINGMLHELWRAGVLDAAIAQEGLIDRFNSDERVTSLLSLRIAGARLALPPTIWLQDELALGMEASLRLRDGQSETMARLFGAVGIALRTHNAQDIVADLRLSALALTCEQSPGMLTPCYSDIVDALRERAHETHAPLSARFTELFRSLTTNRRIDFDGAALTLEGAVLRAYPDPPSAVLRVELGSRLSAP